jgi:hypothetical protein
MVSKESYPTFTLDLWDLLSVYHAILGSWGREQPWIKSPLLFMSSNLGFSNNFQNKICLAPHLILSDRSMCICPHQDIILPLFILLLMIAYVDLKVGYEWQGILASIYCKVKNRIQEKNNSYNQIKKCTCMDVMSMVRCILDPDWVLDITIHDEILWWW